MSDLLSLLGLAFIGSVAGLIGGVIFLVKKEWAKVLCRYAIPLAAGVLLSISLLDLLPRAVDEIGNNAFPIVLTVFIVFFLVERFFFYLHHHYGMGDDLSKHHQGETAIPLVIFGDTIHNFLDGVAIASSFMVNPALGVVVAFSTFLHETPHEVADFGILLSVGWSRRKAFLANLFSALATFPGALLTYFFASRVESAIGTLLAIAAGLFLYVAATDFLPEVSHSHEKSLTRTVFLVIGVLAILLLRVLVPEMH